MLNREMTRSLRIQALLLLILLPLLPLGRVSAAPDLGESLDYILRFRGLLSGFVEIDIAQMQLSVGATPEEKAGRSTYATRMWLTTEFSKKAELIYPVRLDYHSWLDRQSLQPLVAAKSMITGESRREIFWYDRDKNQGFHYQTVDSEDDASGQTPPKQLLRLAALSDKDWSGLRENERFTLDQGRVIDYMGLLHQLRRLPAEPGRWFDFTVFTGKRLEYYRVQMGKQRLIRHGWDRDALHMKLYEYDPEHDKLKDEVQLWVSDDDQRLLLRFYAERTMGALEGILETGRPENGHKEGLPEATRHSLETFLGF